MDQTTKPELAQYLHASLVCPATASPLKAIKQGLLRTWTGFTENLTKKHLEKSRNTTMGHLHIIIQVLKSTIDKSPETYLE